MKSKNKTALLVALSAFAFSPLAWADSIDEQARLDASNIIKSNDRNSDGKLSGEEVDFVFRKTRFAKVDSNGDGLLDQDELTQSYANAARARAQRGGTNQQEPKSAFKKFINETKEAVGLTDKSPTSASNTSNVTYIVQPGDSVYGISKKYNVNLQELMLINGIQDESKLSIGKELIIPAVSSETK